MLGVISFSADMDVITVHAICYLTFMNSNLQNKVPTIISCFTVAYYTEAWWINIHSVHVFVVDSLVELRLSYLAKHVFRKQNLDRIFMFHQKSFPCQPSASTMCDMSSPWFILSMSTPNSKSNASLAERKKKWEQSSGVVCGLELCLHVCGSYCIIPA